MKLFAVLEEEGEPSGGVEFLRVFRGVGPRGAESLRSSEDGVYGPGVYFYGHPYDARAYASPGGGILYGVVPFDKAQVHGNVIVVQDPSDVSVEGIIPSEETSSLEGIDKFLGEDFRRDPPPLW